MQKIVATGSGQRPTGPFGVRQARARLATAYGMVDGDGREHMGHGQAFTRDCAASPALFYANLVPFGDTHKNLAAYFDRLMQRPSLRPRRQGSAAVFKFFPQ